MKALCQEEITFNGDDKKHFSLNSDDYLIISFESENEFLFEYIFKNKLEPISNVRKDKSSIISLNEISRNIILIKNKNEYDSRLKQFYVVITKKDQYNNIETFSDPCYVAKLMINDSNSIIVKTIYESSQN